MRLKIWLLVCVSVPLLMMHHVAQAQMPASLVSFWDFDESNVGTAVAQDQVSSNDGTFTLAATRTAGLVGVGAAILTTAGGNSVNTGSGTGNNFSVTTGITVEALIRPNWDGTGFDHIFRKDDGGNRILFSFQDDASGGAAVPPVAAGDVLSFGLNVGGVYSEMDMLLDGVAGRPTLAGLTDGNTHHIAATYDSASGLKAIYIDGTLRFSTNLGGGNLIASGGGAAARIGSGESAGVASDPFEGVIDEVAFYNAALSAGTISTHYSRAMASVDYFTAVPVSVPALSNLGLILLSLLLLGLGILFQRKKALPQRYD